MESTKRKSALDVLLETHQKHGGLDILCRLIVVGAIEGDAAQQVITDACKSVTEDSQQLLECTGLLLFYPKTFLYCCEGSPKACEAAVKAMAELSER